MNVDMLICHSREQWYSMLASLAQFYNLGNDTLILPVLESHRVLQERIEAFAIHHVLNIHRRDVNGKTFEGLALNLDEYNSYCRYFAGLKRLSDRAIFHKLLTHRVSKGGRLLAQDGSVGGSLLIRYPHDGQHRTGRSLGDCIIAVGEGGVVAGGMLSVMTSRRILVLDNVQSIISVLQRARFASVVLALGGPCLNPRNIEVVRDTAQENSIALGFLYCPNGEVGIWQAMKAKLYECCGTTKRSQIVADCCLPSQFSVGGVSTYFGNDKAGEGMGSLLEEDQECIAILAHSNGIDTSAGHRQTICAKRAWPDSSVQETKVLPCFRGSQCNLVRKAALLGKDQELLATTSLSCNTLFLCACLGLTLDDSMFSPVYSQSHALLCSEKIRSCIFTDRLLEGSAEHLLYFTSLYNMGLSLGCITNRLNALHRRIYSENSPFLLLGDPTLAAASRGIDEIRHFRTFRARTYGVRVCFEVPDLSVMKSTGSVLRLNRRGTLSPFRNSAVFVMCRAENSITPGSVLIKGVLDRSVKDMPLYLTVVGDNMPTSANITITLFFRHSPFESVCNTMREIARNLLSLQVLMHGYSEGRPAWADQNVKCVREVHDETVKMYHRIRCSIRRLESIKSDVVYPEAEFHTQLQAQIQEYISFQRRVLTCVVEICSLSSSMEAFKQPRRAFGRDGDERKLDRLCKYCGSPVYVQSHKSSHIHGMCMALIQCKSCGFVSQITNLLSDTYIAGKSQLRKGSQVAQTVVVKNTTDHEMIVDAVMFIDYSMFASRNKGGSCNPSLSAATIVKRGGRARLTFNLAVPDDCPCGCLVLICIVLINGAMNALRKPIYVS